VLHSSQIAIGEENNLSLRVYGSEASLEWQQEHPNELIVKYPDRPREILRRGNGYASEAAQRVTRIPAGHPEGYLEAFANLYREAFRAIAAEVAGETPPDDLDLPGIDDGVAGMAFIEAAVASARQGAAWVSVAS
jgi:predicted dehydrogenase